MIGKACRVQRLYIEGAFGAQARISCSKDQARYLGNVVRLRVGGQVLVFNGRDGEWLAEIVEQKKKSCVLALREKIREQEPVSDLHYYFAPIKRARLDYMVQKATEMGASRLFPVRTAYSQMGRVNMERMEANAIEAAEQCGILNVPEIEDLGELGQVLGEWDGERVLFFCDEAAAQINPLETLKEIGDRPVGVLIGPEGGFSEDERKMLLACPFVVAISLGPRIMRADTAAVAALALVNAVKGM